MTQVAPFWDAQAERYAASAIRDVPAYEETLVRVRDWLRPEHRVVELGCGTGSTALRLADAVAQYRATDVSGEMLRIGREKAVQENLPGLSFHQFETGTMPDFADCDVLLAFNLFHLVPDLPDVFRQLRASLPTGGLLISKTPCLASRPWLKPLIWGLQKLGKAPSTVHALDTRALGVMIAEAGFEILETGDYPKSPPSRLIVARAI